jgi:hypothetical protein
MALAASRADEAGVTLSVAVGAYGSNLTSWAALAVVLWVAWYLITCALYPWRACTWCDGGKRLNSSGTNWRDCHHCQGSGRRPRAGRVLWNAMRSRPPGK